MGRVTCIFSGRVQGVGFRYTAMNISQSYDVTGYARNLPDGRVELVAEGADQECTGLIEEIRQHMSDYIADVQITKSPGTGEFQRFGIRH